MTKTQQINELARLMSQIDDSLTCGTGGAEPTTTISFNAIDGVDKEKIVKSFLKSWETLVTSMLSNGGSVRLMGFGNFHTHQCAARFGRNPRTGERIEIPASIKPVFTAGSTLKTSLNTRVSA